MLQVVKVNDPGTTCTGVQAADELHIDVFDDRVSISFHSYAGGEDVTETVEIGNTVEFDLDTWDKIAVHVKNASGVKHG